MSNVKKTYKKGKIINEVLKGVNMTVERGEMLCIMGVSGSGKSTLLNVIAGLISLTEGIYYYQDDRLDVDNYRTMEKFRHDKIGVVLQKFALIEDLSIYENIALPLRYQKISSKEIKRRVFDIMGELDLKDKANYYPEELSGGQQQRVAIARALIKQPEIVIADEPTGALDKDNTKKIIHILKDMNRRGITFIIATHDKNISTICNRTLFLQDGVMEEKEET